MARHTTLIAHANAFLDAGIVSRTLANIQGECSCRPVLEADLLFSQC